MGEQGMHDLDGWQRVTCEVAEVIKHANAVRVFSSLTDPDGLYGHPVIYTEWGIPEMSDGDVPLLRDYQWPQDPSRSCEHYVPIPN